MAPGRPNPERVAAVQQSMREAIEREGWMVLSVFPTADEPAGTPPFAYTIGLSKVGLAELLLIAPVPNPILSMALNNLAELMLDQGEAFTDGAIVDAGFNFPLKVIVADPAVRVEYTAQVDAVLGLGDYAVQQVLLCDPQGIYPDDPRCSGTIAQTPVLRTRL